MTIHEDTEMTDNDIVDLVNRGHIDDEENNDDDKLQTELLSTISHLEVLQRALKYVSKQEETTLVI